MSESLVYSPSPAELSPRKATIETAKGENSIFDFYSIDNERQFLQENPFLSRSEQEFYVRENVLRFLGEFVGKVPYSKISYTLQNGLRFGDIDLMNMLKKTSQMAGYGSREFYENAGLAKVYEAFAKQPPASQVLQISPPKDWDYSFAFYFSKEYDATLGKDKVTEYILKYDEKRNQVDQSQKILQSVNPSLVYNSTNEFLSNPLIDSNISMPKLLQTIGIDTESIKKSQLFEQAMHSHLGSWINKYVANVILVTTEYTSGNLPPEQYQVAVANLKMLLTAIYNRAQEIKDSLDANALQFIPTRQISQSGRFEQQDIRLIYAYATSRKAVVQGGGSCAVTNDSGSGSIFNSNFNITQTIKNGLAPEKSLTKEHSKKCPDCQQANSDNHYHCPGCKRRYADETNMSQDKRTKECQCGFKFNC